MTLSAVLFLLQALVPPERVQPVLEFPQPGLDDPAAYEGYRTRFFRDAHGNAFQVYLNQRRGRVVNLWANASNESVGFAVRDAAGQPARLTWASDNAVVSRSENGHSIEYHIQAEPEPLEIGRFVLGTMRVERDFQHHEHDLQPFGAAPFPRPELEELIRILDRLGPDERRVQLELLGAGSVDQLRDRLRPNVALTERDTSWIVQVEQPSFDRRNRLALELIFPRRDADVEIQDGKVLVRPRSGRPIRLALRGTTDAAPLSPLGRGEIFSDEFLGFLGQAAAERDRILRSASDDRGEDRDRLLEIERLERQVRSVELLSYREKLMAGLPNFATYFGRDMLMTALMMQPIWRDVMSEHVVASVLRKLAPSGEVSHEEALGGQAIRENAAVYNTLMADHFRSRQSGDAEAADSALSAARRVLANLQEVRENYGNMMDDDFQFPVLVARYLADERISDERKREFLREPARASGGDSRLALLLQNLAYVSRAAEPYARDPDVMNLVGFRQRAVDEWFPGSWRDSNAGYGNGRFAMDINVIWVPEALESVRRILPILDRLGITAGELQELAPEIRDTPLGRHIADPASLDEAVANWRGTGRHFEVSLSAAEVREQVRAKLASLPEEERAYWGAIFRDQPETGVDFLALSLDQEGRPIPIVNTDPATHLFLENFSDRPNRVLRDVRTFVLPYPMGLLVPELGTLVANDTYAPVGVWEDFRTDHYHSPRVVWGREVNLVILGIANQIGAASAAAPDEHGDPALADHLRELHEALETTVAAAEASGLKHNELWSYRIEDGRLVPVRYGSSSDIQLWNLTDLAVQYELARFGDCHSSAGGCSPVRREAMQRHPGGAERR